MSMGKMPCGARDKRRNGHRCQQCRKDHVKCDGGRPCQACRQRDLLCASPEVPDTFLKVVHYRHHAATKAMTPRSISVPLTQRYHQVFSFAVRLSPILLSAFSPTSLGSSLYGHPFIQHTISLVGGIYACQKPGLLTLSKSDKKELMSQWSTLRNYISKELQGVRRRETDVVLTSALLSSFVELLNDPSAYSWCAWVSRVNAFSLEYGYSNELQAPVQKRLRRLSRIIYAIRNLCLEDFFSDDIPPRRYELGSRAYHLPFCTTSQMPDLEDQLLDQLTEDLEMWAALQYWIFNWIKASKVRDVDQPEQDAEHHLRGVELSCIASQYQQDLIASILWYNNTAGDAKSGMPAFFHCAAVDISRMFLDPAWRSLDCCLPVMTQQLSSEQAAKAFRYAETCLPSLHLEAILYGPVLYTVSIDLEDQTERSRVMSFLVTLRQKGYNVADQFQRAIEQKWFIEPE